MIFFLCNVIVRSVNLDYGSYFLDESANLWYYQQGFDAVIERSLNDVNPPVYGLIISGWIKLFGISEIATRSFSVLMLAVGSCILFNFTKRTFNFKIAFWASLFYLLSDYLVHYAHAARPYALMCLLVILSYAVFYQLTIKRNTRFLWLLILINSVMLYTHPTTVFNLIAQGIYALIFFRNQVGWILKTSLALLASVAAYFWWYSISPAFDKPAITWLEPPSLNSLMYTWGRLTDGWWLTILLFSVSILVLLVQLIQGVKWKYRNPVFLLGVWTFLPLILNAIFSLISGISIFTPQYLITSLAGFYVLLAVMLYRLSDLIKLSSLALILPIVIAMAFGVNFRSTFNESWREVAAMVKQRQTSKTAVYLSPQFQNRSFAYYYDRSYYEQADKTFRLLDSSNVFLEKTTPVADLLGNPSFESIILVIVSENPRKNSNAATLLSAGNLVSETKLDDIYVFEISKFNHTKEP